MSCLRVTESSRLGSWFPQGQQRGKYPRRRQCEFRNCGDFAYLFRAIWYSSDIGGDLAHCAAILLQTLICANQTFFLQLKDWLYELISEMNSVTVVLTSSSAKSNSAATRFVASTRAIVCGREIGASLGKGCGDSQIRSSTMCAGGEY